MRLRAGLTALWGVGLGCGIGTELTGQIPAFAEWHAPVHPILGHPDGPMWRGVIEDFNLDGAPDVLHYGTSTSFMGPRDLIFTWLGDGMGGFVEGASIQFPATPFGIMFSVNGCVAVDLDGDGDLDLVTALVGGHFSSTIHGPMLTFENDGTGTFQLETIWRFPPSFRSCCRELLAFDVDQDGDDDVIMLPYSNEGFPTLLRNDGRGHFHEVPGALPPVSPLWGNCIAVDLNHDGALDFVGTTTDSSPPEIWLDDGSGHFLRMSHGMPPMYAEDVDSGDVDRDGHVDLFFGAYGQRPQLWLGDGRGGFVDSTHRLPVSASSQFHTTVQLVDVDRDGWLDVLYSARSDIRLLRNPGPGSGLFVDITHRVMPWGGGANARFIDTDRDGDLDLLIGVSSPGTHILTNLTRQIHANDPQLGGQLDIDLYGPPGDLASYALSFARLDLRLPGLGWWALDPSLAVAWPQTVSLPVSGTVRSSWTIPNDAGLIGIEVFVQSLQIDVAARTPHLTGFWKSTIRR